MLCVLTRNDLVRCPMRSDWCAPMPFLSLIIVRRAIHLVNPGLNLAPGMEKMKFLLPTVGVRHRLKLSLGVSFASQTGNFFKIKNKK